MIPRLLFTYIHEFLRILAERISCLDFVGSLSHIYNIEIGC